MQKKLIAVAVAGLVSGAAFAQSNVTVYGIMDIYYANVNPSGAAPSVNSINSGGLSASRVGLKGVEDLGSGLKAYFNVESAISAGQDTTAASAFGGATRQSYIGLSGGFGAVQVGTQSSLSDAWSGAYDYAGDLSAKTFLRAGASTGIAKVPNSIAYISPNFSGLTVGLAHVMDEVGGTNGDTNQLGLNYANGPITATYVYSRTGAGAGTTNTTYTCGAGVFLPGTTTTCGNDTNGNGVVDYNEVYASTPVTTTVPGNTTKGNFFGIGYDFKVAKVMFEYTDVKSAGNKDKFYQIGGVIPVTAAGNIHVGTGWTKEQNGDKARSSIIAYTHGLSKRTTAYAGYVVNDQKDGNGDGAFSAGIADDKRFAVGLRHTF